jgi:hypothetical protein
MGKLHTLRRAIEREPNKFINTYARTALPVYCYRGTWYPRSYSLGNSPYRTFVRKVLCDLGYVVQ